MEINKFIKEKRVGLSIVFIFFTFLIFSLLLRIFFLNRLYPYSIFFIILVFILSQYFEFDYKLFIVLALILMLIYVFFLSYNLTIAKYFNTYAYMFFILGGLVYLLSNLKEKLKNKVINRLYRVIFLYILIIVVVLSAIIFINYNSVFIKNVILGSSELLKDRYLRTFNKEIYYSKKEFATIDGEKVKDEIIISTYSSLQGSLLPGKIKIKGWAIEKNSKYDSGIDRIELFFNGKPGEGKYLGKFSQNYNLELRTLKFISLLYINFYSRLPDSQELDFWGINLEYGIMSYSEVAKNIINKSAFMYRNLSNKDFLSSLYLGLLNRDWDGSLMEKLENDLTRKELLDSVINSDEFKNRGKNYYNNISIKKNNLDIIRSDVGKKYGKQFCLSGFSFELDSKKIENGKYLLYIYTHSPNFGWGNEVININIKN